MKEAIAKLDEQKRNLWRDMGRAILDEYEERAKKEAAETKAPAAPFILKR
jgi:hypothetical protein